MTLQARIVRALAARRRRLAAPLAALLALASLAAAGCGDDVPEGSVAKVGDATIERSEFDHWLTAAARGQQPPGAGGEVVVPDPPDFQECVSSKEEQVAPPEGQQQQPEAPSAEQLKQQCEQEYETLKQQVMQFLIEAETIQQEAAARNIELSEAEVTQQFEDLKAQSFKDDKEFTEFLETSGRTVEDLTFQVRIDLLSNKIRESVVAEGGEVTDAEVQTYYDENQDQPPIGEPETRDIEVVLTEEEAEAEDARQQLEDGDSFAKVAKEFSIDEASKSEGGKLEGVQEGQQEMALDEAVFSAQKGELVGPIETEFGFYVFEVTDIQEGKQQTLEESSEAITQILRSQQEQELLNDFIEEFQSKYKEETVCADDFVVQGCKNAPDSEDTEAAPGAPPGVPQQGAPQQGAPPQGVPPGGPQGVPPGGPQGVPPGGPQGVPPGGVPPEGVPPEGAPPQGAPPQGVPPGGGG